MTAPPQPRPSTGPLIGPPTASLARELRVLEPILYGDVFEHPLTLDEVWRYSPLPVSRDDITRMLRGPLDGAPAEALIGCRGGYYHLRGREGLVPLRLERLRHSRRLWKRARRVAGAIQYVPFVRALAVTGSLANDNAGAGGDPDFLVITAPGRIWTVFAALGTLQRLTSPRLLCPNYYLSAAHLRVGPQDFYSAREVVQSVPLYGIETYGRFREANAWVRRYYPNDRRPAPSVAPAVRTRPGLASIKRRLERLAGGSLGDRLESALGRLLLRRLHAHYRRSGGAPPAEILENALLGRELRFHGLGHRTAILAAIRRRLERLEGQLGGPSRRS